MQAKAEKNYSLLRTDAGIYGLYEYHSTWTSKKGPLNDPVSQTNNNIVSGFKSRGHNSILFSRRIKQIAKLFNCTRIVAVPPHDLTQNNLQKLFPGDGIIRLKPGPKRKYQKNTLNPADFKINDPGDRTLIVDDISTSGYTLQFFAKKFTDPVLFAIGVNAKMNPKVIRSIQDEEPPPDVPETKKAPDTAVRVQDVSDRVAFIAALKNGMGLTRACSLIHKHPKEWSAMIRSDLQFFLECEEALKFSAKALLVMSNEFLQDKKFDKWMNQNQYIQHFHTVLVLWESYRLKKDVTDMDIITGYKIFKDLGEMATAIGFTEMEMIEYITGRERLAIYFTDIGVLK